MTNLILPKHYINQTLEKNLEALFERYPYERARLEPILRAPAKPYPLAKIEIPAVPSKPPIRIILLCGIGNPEFLATLLNDKDVQRENFKLFIFEQDPEFLAFCFQNADLTQVIRYHKTEWFLCHTPESIKPALFIALRPEPVTSMAKNVQQLQIEAPKTPEADAFYKRIPQLYDESLYHIFHNHGNLMDSLLGVRLTLANKEHVLSCPGIEDLKDYYRGCTALLVGAGPSLDSALDSIKKYNDRFIVIAADAAFKPLIKAGIRVDYVTSIERCNKYQVPFFTDMEKTTAELVAFPVVYPEIFKIFPGKIRIPYRNYSYFAYFQRSWPKTLLRCGGSTSHLGLRLASFMGCRKLVMIGLDSCYEKSGELYRSHCRDTGYTEWSEFIPLEDFSKKRNHAPPFEVLNNAGEPAITNITYYQWIKEYAEELAHLGHKMSFVNASRQGIKIDGIPYQPLDEIAETLLPITVEKPPFPTSTIHRTWDHKELLKNLKGWLAMSEAAIKEADELLKMETINPDRFHILVYLFNLRCVNDTLFIAFIIQCAAFDFFHLENKWWYLDVGITKDYREKTQVMKERFELFKKTTALLIEMFEEKADE